MKKETIVKIVISIFMLLFLALVALIVTFVAMVIIGPSAFPLVSAVFISLYVLFIIHIFGLYENKKVTKSLLSVCGLMIAIGIGFIGNYFYHQGVAKVDEPYVDLSTYEPFQANTKAVSLNEPSALKLTGDLPIIDGATALYPLYSAFVRATYPEKQYFYDQSEVMSSRTGEAYKRLFIGEVDLIFAPAPSAAQIRAAEQSGRELNMTPIGREAFVFFVNSKNPVKELTTGQLKGIYSGEIKNWKEVGGKNDEIRAFQRPEDSGSQTALQKFMGNTPILEPRTENIASLMGDIIQIASYRNYKNSLGYTFRYYSTEMVQNKKIRLLAIDGIEPTKETIRSDEYPLTSEFYAITAGSDNPNIEAFIDWILSEQGQYLVEQTGYVPVK